MAAITCVSSGVCFGEVDLCLDLSDDPEEWKGRYCMFLTRYPTTSVLCDFTAIYHIALSTYA